MYDGLPAPFQVRVHLQALSNALRRPTSDRLKLLRLSGEAAGVLARTGVEHPRLTGLLGDLSATLSADREVDRDGCAAELDRLGAEVCGKAPFTAVAARERRLTPAGS